MARAFRGLGDLSFVRSFRRVVQPTATKALLARSVPKPALLPKVTRGARPSSFDISDRLLRWLTTSTGFPTPHQIRHTPDSTSLSAEEQLRVNATAKAIIEDAQINGIDVADYSDLMEEYQPFMDASGPLKLRRPIHNRIKVLLESDSQLAGIRAATHEPDSKSNCGISAVSFPVKAEGFNVGKALECPSESLKARYFITDGGGDGGGMSAQCTPESLAEYYECDVSVFENQDTKIAQISFAKDKAMQLEQLAKIEDLFTKNGIKILLRKEPETDFSCLRDGHNGERNRQGVLHHFVIQPPDGMQTDAFDSLCTSIIATFNLSEKSIDLKTTGYSPAGFFGITHNVIVCKSFQGNTIGKLFPFLHKLNATDLFFHGREATNTAPLRGSIHPTPEITIKHNGEINNIKGLRRSLAQNPEFITFIGWTGSKEELADTIGQYSDTAMLSLYVAFKKSQGMETGDILRALFLPDAAETSLGFVAEGPAFVLVRDGKSTYIVNDAQAQRPIKLDVLMSDDGQIYGYRAASVPGMETPFSDDIEQLQVQWKSVHTKPGEVLKLRENEDNKFELKRYDSQKTIPLVKIHKNGTPQPEGQMRIASPIPDLKASRKLVSCMYDGTLKVAMGDQSRPGHRPRLCTAGITNTSQSPNINKAHESILFCIEPSQFLEIDHALISHDQYELLGQTDAFSTINACVSREIAFDAMHDGGLLNAEFDRILNQVEDQINEGKRSIEISFIDGANIPLFPRELLISKISDLLSQHGKDGISNPQDKVNIIVTTHSTMNAQDAYTLMSAGADFIYNPHLTGRTEEDYSQELSSQRNTLMLLAMRAGITRLSQLSKAGLHYYQDAHEIAMHQGVINIGGNQYGITDAFRHVVDVLDGVAVDPGVAIGSHAERLNTEKAILIKTNQRLAQRAITATDDQVQLVPTKYSTLPKNVVVLGAGAAGVSVIENFPLGEFKILLVERAAINRLGNANYISGDHDVMRQSILHRMNAVLERPDVVYLGGLRKTFRQGIVENAHYIYDTRGDAIAELPSHIIPARDFLTFAYAGSEFFTDQFSHLHPEFLKERSAQNVYITGLGEVSWDVLKAFLGVDSRSQNPARLFARWRDSYTQHGIFLSSRGPFSNFKWSHSRIHELAEICERDPRLTEVRLITPSKDDLPAELQKYYYSMNDDGPPTDGINILFNTTIGDANTKQNKLPISFGDSLFTLPHIGTHIQGYIPVVEQNSDFAKFGWASGKSTSMAGIGEDVKANMISPPGKGERDVKVFRDANKRIDHILQQAVYINNAQQKRVMEMLIKNGTTPDAEIVRILKTDEKIPSESREDPTSPAEPKKPNYDHLLHDVEKKPGYFPLIIVHNDEHHTVYQIESGSGSHLDAIAEKFNLTLDQLACSGEGTCSECASLIEIDKLPPQGPAEKAILTPFTNRFSEMEKLFARTICQIESDPRAVVIAPDSDLYRLIEGGK